MCVKTAYSLKSNKDYLVNLKIDRGNIHFIEIELDSKTKISYYFVEGELQKFNRALSKILNSEKEIDEYGLIVEFNSNEDKEKTTLSIFYYGEKFLVLSLNKENGELFSVSIPLKNIERYLNVNN